MCSEVNYQPVGNKIALRILGSITTAAGFLEIIIGLVAFTFFTNFHAGSWWGAILMIVSGILCIASTNRSVVVAGCVVGSIGIVVAVIATLVDGLSLSFFKQLQGCCNGNMECDGSNAGIYNAMYCAKKNYYYTDSLSNCYCVNDDQDCSHLILTHGTDCGTILHQYVGELSASTAFLALGTFTLLIMSVYCCATLCCSRPNVEVTLPTVSEPLLNPTAPPAYNEESQYYYATDKEAQQIIN